MQLSDTTREYFRGLHETRSFDEMLDLIEAWLDVHFSYYEISLQQWIYHKGDYINEFYDAIDYGTHKTTI